MTGPATTPRSRTAPPTGRDTAADGTFVLTSGRSGSTLLARLLHTHPDLVIVSDLLEPATPDPYYDRDVVLDGERFWRLLARRALRQRVDHWRRWGTDELLYLPERDDDVSLLMAYTLPFLTPGAPWELRADLEAAVTARPAAPAPDHFLFVCRWLRDRFGASVWVERTGGSLPHAASIVRAWPDARYVLLTRDPAETALSMRTGSFFRLCLAIEEGDPEHWLATRYADPVHLAAMVDRWSTEAERALSTLPGERLHHLTYERLTSEPVETLAAVAGFALGRSPSAGDIQWATRAAPQVKRAPTRLDELGTGEADRVLDACRASRRRWCRLVATGS